MSSEVWQLYNGILQNVVIHSVQKGLKMPSLCLMAVCFLNEVFPFHFTACQKVMRNCVLLQ